jgi:hypothetical protein
MFSLSLYSVSLREDLFSEALGEIPLDFGKLFVKGEVFGQGLSGPTQVVATFIAKGAVRLTGVPARRAQKFQLGSTLLAELGSLSVLEVAASAFHLSPLLARKRTVDFRWSHEVEKRAELQARWARRFGIRYCDVNLL